MQNPLILVPKNPIHLFPLPQTEWTKDVVFVPNSSNNNKPIIKFNTVEAMRNFFTFQIGHNMAQNLKTAAFDIYEEFVRMTKDEASLSRIINLRNSPEILEQEIKTF